MLTSNWLSPGTFPFDKIPIVFVKLIFLIVLDFLSLYGDILSHTMGHTITGLVKLLPEGFQQDNQTAFGRYEYKLLDHTLRS